MIPVLYERDERNFVSNGICRLPDIVDGFVTEEINGVYELEFKYPINGFNYDQIQEGLIIAVFTDATKVIQPFDIYGRSEPINGIVTFYAHHISYRLSKMVCTPFTAQGPIAAMKYAIEDNCVNNNGLFSWSCRVSQNAELESSVPRNVRDVLLGDENSIASVYDGEFRFYQFWVEFKKQRGEDKGVTIYYGKNLTKLTRDTDDSETYNAIYPYWVSNTGDSVTMKTLPDEGLVLSSDLPKMPLVPRLSSGFVTSDSAVFNVNQTAAEIKAIPMDISEYFDEEPTDQQIREKTSSLLEGSQAWIPKETFSIEFEQMWESEAYGGYSALQRCSLGDYVMVVNNHVKTVKIKMEIVKVVYDFVLEKYRSMDLGTPRKSFAETIAAATADFVKDLPSKDFMQEAIDYATKLICGGLGGHVVLKTNANGEPEEILIMDTDDVNTAVNVWRFNLGGLGHSHSGYNGPFDDVALTMDGRINANMISTGVLNAGLIKAGILQGLSGNSYWNLETGELHIEALESIESDIDDLQANYTNLSVDVDGISTEVGHKVGDDEIISKINQSAEQIAIDASKISLSGKEINLNTDNIIIKARDDHYGTETLITYDSISEIPLVDYGYPFRIGGTKGNMEIGYTDRGYLTLQVGSIQLYIVDLKNGTLSLQMGYFSNGTLYNGFAADQNGVSVVKNGQAYSL